MRKYEIAINLKPEGSEHIRTLLEENGFAIYKHDPLSRSLDRLKESNNIHFLPTGSCNCIFCIYNGDKSLKEMGINQGELENSGVVVSIKIQVILDASKI